MDESLNCAVVRFCIRDFGLELLQILAAEAPVISALSYHTLGSLWPSNE